MQYNAMRRINAGRERQTTKKKRLLNWPAGTRNEERKKQRGKKNNTRQNRHRGAGVLPV